MADSDTERRRKSRAFKIFNLSMLMERRIGKADVMQVQQTGLAIIAEMKGLWQALLDKGIITEAQRQDYLDRGVDSLAHQVESKASEIDVESSGKH